MRSWSPAGRSPRELRRPGRPSGPRRRRASSASAGTRRPPVTGSAPERRCCARPTITGPPTSTAARIPPLTPSRRGLAKASQQTFADAAALLDTPARALHIPYEDTTLPAYLFLADDSSTPRPTLLCHGGYDSTREENYFALAAGALRRGYNVIAFDGPGQGSTVREQGLHFRPDWEAVVTPVVDLALTVPEVDAERLVLVGTSLGGILAPRAAAFDHRLAACVLHDGAHDFHAVVVATASRAGSMPGGMEALMAQNTMVRWVVRNGRWTFGVSDMDELAKASEAYTMAGIADRITCPTLVLDAENDQFFKGQPQRLFDELTCQKELISFRENEGAGEHCHEGAMFLFHQRTFDRLDTLLAG